MSCKWKDCKGCEGTCLWARGMARQFMDSNLEPRLQERIDIDCSKETAKLLGSIKEFADNFVPIKQDANIIIEADDAALATLLSVKFLQNYFNQNAIEAAVDPVGVYVPYIKWIKQEINEENEHLRVKHLIHFSKIVVWDIYDKLTEYQRDQFTIKFRENWAMGKCQIVTLQPGWKVQFKDSVILGMLERAKVVRI